MTATAPSPVAYFPNVGLGILSWRAHRTLRRTLRTLADADMFSLFGESLIYFQEMCGEDRAIAREFNLRTVGGNANIGIRGGMKALAESLQCEYVLHLENDFSLIGSRAEAMSQLKIAVRHLRENIVDLYHLRHRNQEGGGLKKYLRYHSAPELNESETPLRILRRILRPAKAHRLQGLAIFADSNPEQKFPRCIRRLEKDFFAVDSACMNWTNQTPLYPRRWFLDELIPFAEAHPTSRTVNKFPDLEKELNCRWWRAKHFRVGVAPGLFTHTRADRPPHDEKRFR